LFRENSKGVEGPIIVDTDSRFIKINGWGLMFRVSAKIVQGRNPLIDHCNF
jgi:hypothetical protein